MSNDNITGRTWHDRILDVIFTVGARDGYVEGENAYLVASSDMPGAVRMTESVIKHYLGAKS